MTGNAIKKILEHHNISPKTISHYDNSVIGLFFKPDQLWEPKDQVVKQQNKKLKTAWAILHL